MVPDTAVQEQERTVLAGRYEVIETLGGGAFGLVHKAWDRLLHRTVAIKVMRMEALVASGIKRDEVIKRFEREATTAAGLTHPAIVTIYDIGTVAGTPYLAMEYIDSVGLDRVIARERRLSPDRAAVIALEVSEALEYAHAHGVLHRDVKPPNIVVPRTPGKPVKLVDFGLAKALDCTDHLTRTGTFLGTPSYASPEHVSGEAMDGRSDLWSVGCVLYEMLTGEKAFNGLSITEVVVKIMTTEPPPVRELDPGLPEDLARIVGKAMAKDPTARYASASELVADLRRFVRSRAAAGAEAATAERPPEAADAVAHATMIVPSPERPAPPAAIVLPPPDRARSRRGLAVAGALLGIAALAGIATLALTRGPGDDAARGAPLPGAASTAPMAAAPEASAPPMPVTVPAPEISAAAPAVTDGLAGAARSPVVPAQGRAHITSAPPGARVSIDGREAGPTPLTSTLPAGRHTILVVADGHQPWSAEVSIERGRTTSVHAPLEAIVAPPPTVPAEVPSGPYRADEVDTKPVRLSLDVPAYPRGAPPLKRGQTVSVTLSFVVGVDGSVSDVSVARSSGVPAVDEAVMAAARKARYRPGTRSGAPVPTRMSHAFSFRGA